MIEIDFDVLVKSAAIKLCEGDVAIGAAEAECRLSGRAWNMNQPLNMIAYEDQK
ncbi:hypothetical protein [Pandoraea sputorum]|uniref:Uncharacterized protein n=1 Tax=Pandoraea sputorum TaxID=93222 RepID=A0A5E5B002_9BURK|nr:hypothetical protein [Pandoraea sputorum]BET11516.1 hypothetical protein THI4931_25580 [Pandoraea sputorum]VVE78627.1 hypothetical protein PSP31121_01757 [Pandoraea sputorum]